MSFVKTHIISQEYHDSVQLMKAAANANKIKGVEIITPVAGQVVSLTPPMPKEKWWMAAIVRE